MGPVSALGAAFAPALAARNHDHALRGAGGLPEAQASSWSLGSWAGFSQVCCFFGFSALLPSGALFFSLGKGSPLSSTSNKMVPL